MNITTEILVNRSIIEGINKFTYLGYDVSYAANYDVCTELQKHQYLCSTIKRTCYKLSTSYVIILKFYKVLAVSKLLYGCKSSTLLDRKIKEWEETRFLRDVTGQRRNEYIRKNVKIF